VYLRRQEWAGALLDAFDRREVFPEEIDAGRRQRLLEHPAAVVRERAAKQFPAVVDRNRQKVVSAYQSALNLAGDAGRGLEVFIKHCASCHRVGNFGQAVGPDLAAQRDKSPEWFLQALFDPGRAVDAKYVNFTVVTKGGIVYSGVLSQESGNSITLTSTTGKREVILRSDIEELASSGKSAMPEGFETDLKHQDVADLLAFLRAGRPLLKLDYSRGP
jgi:putative heme-binding domain-containing protein